MALEGDNTDIKPVEGISVENLQRIKDFLQGSVRCWCKNRKGEWFFLRDLVGGDNYDWSNTPLIVLYLKHEAIEDDEDEAIKKAGYDAGWLLKTVLKEEAREFETQKSGNSRQYRWKV